MIVSYVSDVLARSRIVDYRSRLYICRYALNNPRDAEGPTAQALCVGSVWAPRRFAIVTSRAGEILRHARLFIVNLCAQRKQTCARAPVANASEPPAGTEHFPLRGNSYDKYYRTRTRARGWPAARPAGSSTMGVTPRGGPDQPSSGAGVSEGVSPRRHAERPQRAHSTARTPRGSFGPQVGRANGLDSRHVPETTCGAVHDPDGDVGGAHSQKGILPCTCRRLTGGAYSFDPPLTEPHVKRMSPREADFEIRE